MTARFPGYRARTGIGRGLVQWTPGVAFVYLFTFGLGKVLPGEPVPGGVMLAACVPAAAAVLAS